MSVEKAASTSSDATANSKPWPEVATLGALIVEQLGIDRTNDTLSRWLAHRVAELLQASESDEVARREASDLILRLWERRSTWPHGWPPPAIGEFTKWMLPRQRFESTARSPWAARAGQFAELLTDEYRVWLLMAIAEEDVPLDEAIPRHEDRFWWLEREAEAIAKAASEITPEELAMRDLVLAVVRPVEHKFRSEFLAAEGSAERAALAKAELERLAAERLATFDDAQSAERQV